MQLTTITEQNIALIRFRIEQFIKRIISIKMQSFYNTDKMYQDLGITNMIGISNNQHDIGWITKSGIWHYNPKSIELDIFLDNKKPYIRIILNFECGMTIKLGDKIKITPTNIFLKENHSILKIMNKNIKSPFTIISKGDYELAQDKEWRDKRDAEDFNDFDF